MHTAAEPRVRKRLPCRVKRGPIAYSGVVLNLSRTGLFVQTGASPVPGESIELDLRAGTDGSGIPLKAKVVWRRHAPPELRNLVAGGVGVRIERAEESYYQLLSEVQGRPADPPVVRAEPAPTGWTDVPSKVRYRVRMNQTGGTRTRVVEVDGEGEHEARAKALARMGQGWVVMELTESRG